MGLQEGPSGLARVVSVSYHNIPQMHVPHSSTAALYLCVPDTLRKDQIACTIQVESGATSNDVRGPSLAYASTPSSHIPESWVKEQKDQSRRAVICDLLVQQSDLIMDMHEPPREGIAERSQYSYAAAPSSKMRYVEQSHEGVSFVPVVQSRALLLALLV